MGSMKDLLGDTPAHYPGHPGWSEPDTSLEAAVAMADAAPHLRAAVVEHLKDRPSTVHETAEALQLSVPSIQPRFSELRAEDQIEPTGEHRTNESGRRVHVWRLKPQSTL